VLAEANIIYRLLAAKPIFCGFNVTSRCTMRCRFCSVPDLPHRDMTMEEIKHVLRLLKQIGIPVVGVTGGEPFMRNDLAEILLAIQNQGMMCTVVTNGELLSRQRMKELKDVTNIVHFALSVDSLDLDTYEALRGKRNMPRLLARYLDCIGHGPTTVYKLNVVLGPDNLDEIDTFFTFAHANQLALSFIPMNIGPGGLHRGKNFPTLDVEARKRVADAFRHLHARKLAGAPLWDHRDFYLLAARYMEGEPMGDCMAGRLFLDLRSDGGLAFCNEMDHFVDLLQLDSLTPDFVRSKRMHWQPRIDACRRDGACCYTCSYNVTATANNIPAYVWDYFRLKLTL
jgi:MoaA/NifB/PqqE/SkfB family radical SAM enzyme